MATFNVWVNATNWKVEAKSMTDAFRLVVNDDDVWPQTEADADQFNADIEIQRMKG